MKIWALILSALVARTAFGWSDTWETIPADSYHEPTQREWMELVWATKERIVAASQSECGFYRGTFTSVYTGWEQFCSTNDGYYFVSSNYNDMLEQWVFETNASYKDDFWEPSMKQQTDLAIAILGLRSVFTATNTDALANNLSAYWPWPEPWSNDVPQWVYYAASNTDFNADSDGYKGIPPMPWPWSSNPYLEFGGEERVYSNRPIGIVAVPVFESGPDGTAIVQDRHVLKTFRNQKTVPDGWFALVADELPSKADYGIGSCSSIVFRFESDATNGWWSTNVYSFKGWVATTNPDPAYLDFLLGSGEIPMGINWTLNYLMATNEVEWSGTLPMEVALSNSVPLSVDWSGDAPVSTQPFPELTVELKNVRTMALHDPSSHNVGIREGLASWNRSWKKMKFFQSVLTNMGSKTVMDCRLAKLIRSVADVSTNVCAGPGDCGDLSRMPLTVDDLYVVLVESNMNYRYNFSTNGWEEEGFSLWKYEGSEGSKPTQIARIHYSSTIPASGGEDACQGMSAYADLYPMSSFIVDIKTDNYMTDRFPSSDVGTPRVVSADIWGSVSVITNIPYYHMNWYFGDTIGWYPEDPLSYIGTYEFRSNDLVCSGQYFYTGWEPTGNAVLRVGEGITNPLSINGISYMSAAQTQAAMAWVENCIVSTNSGGIPFAYSRSGYSTVNGIFFALATWQFATNFDARWDAYEAASTNAP